MPNHSDVDVCTPLQERYPLLSATMWNQGDEFVDRFCDDGNEGLFRHRGMHAPHKHRYESPFAGCLPEWHEFRTSITYLVRVETIPGGFASPEKPPKVSR